MRVQKNFPYKEVFSLTNQMRRSAISIPSNISEGFSRNSAKEFIQFLYIALGSSAELETQILISQKWDICLIQIDLSRYLQQLRRCSMVSFHHEKGK